MIEPQIVPLARRLAEENNVNWRSLQGSGVGGSIVERDVLNHLARVMIGEEDVIPTPEPVPTGMDVWPEELVPPAPQAPAEEVWSFGAPLQTSARQLQEEPDFFNIPLTETPAPQPEPFYTYIAPAALQEAPQGVSKAAHQAVLEEAEHLKGEVRRLERERARFQNELRQVALLRETVQVQEAELQGLSALREEVQSLKRSLAAAKAEAERKRALEAEKRELEGRLERARDFKEKAKAEVERLGTLNESLKGELEALKKRRWWKFWG